VVVTEAATNSIVVPVDFEINTAGHLDVIMSNSTVIDAGAIPVAESFAQSFKGVWQPLTHYFENDLFTAPNSKWLGAVLLDHTSASSFDWGANDGMGHDYYAVAIPLAPSPTTVGLSSSAHTLTLDDINTYIRCTSSGTGGVLITIPTDSSVPFPTDTDIHFCQRGDPITFTPGGGVTLNSPADSSPITAEIGAVATLKKVNTNEWDLFGRLQLIGGSAIRQPNSAALSLSGSLPLLLKSLTPGSGVLALARGTPIRTP
jgi:hypothetical protein